MKKLSSQTGFTLVELMISTAIFSSFLFFITGMMLRLGRTYTKGIISSQTQNAARAIVTEIGYAIQFSANAPNYDNATYICAGSQRYSYNLGKQLKLSGSLAADQSAIGLVADNPTACPGGPIANPQRELLDENMRLANLSITNSGASGLFTITVRVVYGDFSALDNPTSTNAVCKSSAVGSAFCSASEFSTTVQKRL